jgi:hypothetical protein
MKHFNSVSIFTLITLLLLPTAGYSAKTLDPSALTAAESFLQMLDNDEYQMAWNQTSIVNQSYHTYPQWFNKILAVRPHLGYAIERSVAKTSYHSSWVGLPDGEYLRISFSTSFLNKTKSLETVILSREGAFWSVSSYHLR